MSIVFTSFQRSPLYHGDKFAICDRQPLKYNYPGLFFFSPVNHLGKPIRSSQYFRRPKYGFDPHDYYNAVKLYRQDVMAGYCQNLKEIKFWLKAISAGDDLVLCCWCPHSQAARSQINDLGVMACHSGLVAEIITLCRPDITVIMDIDRSDRLVPQWQFGILEQPYLFDVHPLQDPDMLLKFTRINSLEL